MSVHISKKSETLTLLTVAVDADDLKVAKEHAINKLKRNLKVTGFREGKVPIGIAEKHIDPAQLQTEFLDEAINHGYQRALRENNLRPVVQPKIELKKFVPYNTVEFTAEIETLGKITLPDYRNIKITRPKVEVSDEEINQVIENMKKQMADKLEVDRAAKVGDEVWIDFSGVDQKGQPVKGADGKNYPLSLGSNTFIPGFEKNLIGLKKGDDKTFNLTFPKDYGVKALQNRKITFSVKINQIKEVTLPEINKEFLKKIGNFNTDKDLNNDIKKQLGIEKSRNAEKDYEALVIQEVTDKAIVDLPAGLLEDQAKVVMDELRQNIVYRGMTFEEYLDSVGMTEKEQYEKEILPEAERRLKAGLVLAEIADKEKITVTEEEIEIRLQVLKSQHQNDAESIKELNKPETKQSIASRIHTEKTIAKLVSIVEK